MIVSLCNFISIYVFCAKSSKSLITRFLRRGGLYFNHIGYPIVYEKTRITINIYGNGIEFALVNVTAVQPIVCQ